MVGADRSLLCGETKMYIALSLKNGEQIEASKASYAATRNLLLVCPECGEPVHFKNRQYPHNTDFFAHPKELPLIKLIKACSLRVEGGVFQKASHIVPGISQGQLVDKFQKEFCKELYESMGGYSKTLYEFIKSSGFERLTKKDYRNLISSIRIKAPGEEILMRELNATELTLFREGIDDICLFLESPYGVWVGNFVYQAAYFTACMLHPGTLNKSLGTGIFFVKGSKIIFVLDRLRIRRWAKFAAGLLSANSKRNLAIFKIAATLVSFLVLKWRFKSYVPKLMAVADDVFERAEEKAAALNNRNAHKRVPGDSSAGTIAMKSSDEPKRILESKAPNPVKTVTPLPYVQSPQQVLPHSINPERYSNNYQYTGSKVDTPVVKKAEPVELHSLINPEGHSNNYQYPRRKVEVQVVQNVESLERGTSTQLPRPGATNSLSTEFYPIDNPMPDFYGLKPTSLAGRNEQFRASPEAPKSEASARLNVPLLSASATDERRLPKEAESNKEVSTTPMPERREDAFQTAGSRDRFLAPRNLLFRRVPTKGDVSPPIMRKPNVAEPSSASYSPKKNDDSGRTVLPYVLSYEEKERITRLIKYGKNLPLPSSFLDSKEELLAWSRLNRWNPIEAHFLAGFRKVPHRTAEFTDDTLTARLTEWIRWAQTLTDV